MSTLSNQIEQVQPDVFYKLASEPAFAPFSIFTVREKRIDSEIAKALSGIGALTLPKNILSRKGSKSGASIEIQMPALKTAMPDTPGPICTLEQVFLVKEYPMINEGVAGSGISAEEIAVNIAETFHLFFMGGPLQGFYAASNFYRQLDGGPDATSLILQVTLNATFVLQAVQRTAGPVVSTVSNGDGTDTVTLTDAQPGGGSTIYYTIDGTFPGVGNSKALVYSAPFIAAVGTVVRTSAVNGSLQGSMVDTFIIS